MCGVCGVSFKKDLMGTDMFFDSIAIFKMLLVENTDRGKDSTGIVYLADKEYNIKKGFAKGSDAQYFVMPATNQTGMLGHTRYATIGNKTDIKNVHPFETTNLVGIHNGTIFNHKELKKRFNIKTKGTCDSEVVLQLIDQEGIEGLKYVYGTYMLVFIQKSNPNKIYIITNGTKPLVLLFNKSFLAFGSIAKDTLKEWNQTESEYKINTLSAEPSILYELENGKIVNKTKINNIICMTEKEGELRYKLEYKIFLKDSFNEAVPVQYRLPKPKPAVITISSSLKKALCPNLQNSTLKEIMAFQPEEFSTAGTFALTLFELLPNIGNKNCCNYKNVGIPLSLFFCRNYGNPPQTNKDNSVTFSPIYTSKYKSSGAGFSSTNSYFRNMYALEILITLLGFSDSVSIYRVLERNPTEYQKENLFYSLGSPAEAVATLLCSQHNPRFDKILELVTNTFVKTGLLYDTFIDINVHSVYSTTNEYIYDKINNQGMSPIIYKSEYLSNLNAGCFSGINLRTDAEHLEFCKKFHCISSEYVNYTYTTRVLFAALVYIYGTINTYSKTAIFKSKYSSERYRGTAIFEEFSDSIVKDHKVCKDFLVNLMKNDFPNINLCKDISINSNTALAQYIAKSFYRLICSFSMGNTIYATDDLKSILYDKPDKKGLTIHKYTREITIAERIIILIAELNRLATMPGYTGRLNQETILNSSDYIG